ncbi:MAG: ABC transporter permease, partial [Spirochaetota bacterium]
MIAYIIRRVLYIIPMLVLISVIAFIAMELPPGDYVSQQIEQIRMQYGQDDEAVERRVRALRDRYGLDQPPAQRYFTWIGNIILRGDFGRSFVRNQPVLEIVGTRIGLTLILSLSTLVFAWIVAIPIGVYSAIRQYHAFDYGATFVAFIGRATPNFLLALILMYIMYRWFGWSVGGLFSPEYLEAPWSWGRVVDLLQHLLLPIIVIGTADTAGLVRVLRGMVLDELHKDYVMLARAKGMPEHVVIWKHIFKIAALPVVSTIGWLLPRLISGAAITSVVLNLPTTGQAMLQALQNQDMYVAGAFILILSTLTMLGTLLS